MVNKPLEKTDRLAWSLLPVFIVVMFLSLWWLKQNDAAAASVLAPVLAISLMAYITVLTTRQQRRLDEVQVASQGFANSHGFAYGAMVTIALLMLPPVKNWLVDLLYAQSTGSPDLFDRRAVGRAFIYGASLVVLVQTILAFVAAVVWWRRMGGMREQAQ